MKSTNMPKRHDIKKILLIGSGPIVIGQACEFDYSGTQAVKALKEEGYSVILVNSNPATVMTDPRMTDRTYIEPLKPEPVAQIIARERPDAILPTLGGQTALNLSAELDDAGVLKQFGVECIGAHIDVIRRAEQRELFKKAMKEIGLDTPRSGIAYTLEEARHLKDEIGLPLIVRPSFTLGGKGGGIEEPLGVCESLLDRFPQERLEGGGSDLAGRETAPSPGEGGVGVGGAEVVAGHPFRGLDEIFVQDGSGVEHLLDGLDAVEIGAAAQGVDDTCLHTVPEWYRHPHADTQVIELLRHFIGERVDGPVEDDVGEHLSP